jgi:gluconate 2-dehydrogenase gamma chain
MEKVTRRSFVATVGAVTVVRATALLSLTAHAAGPAPAKSSSVEPAKTAYLFFDAEEALFIEAACDRLIPADESGPGALGARVPNYLDRQLGGAWGAGERLYRSGPWQSGTPSRGCQSPFSPAELFHASLRAIRHDLGRGTPFHGMSAQAKDAYLQSLESGAADLDGVPSAVFFDMLLKMTVEGFFSDPVYGGNRDTVAWRMTGFPGAYACIGMARPVHSRRTIFN